MDRKYYPRPQMMRKEWINLDGEWKFLFDDDFVGEKEKWFEQFPKNTKRIQVPFTYETEKSGINDQEIHSVVWYQKEIQLEDVQYAINFEGSDYHTHVWVNGFKVGEHTGGYTRFSLDLHDYAVVGKNTITVKVTDSLSTSQVRGKQRWLKTNFGCWYVQTTGIWKTVWLEKVPKERINRLKLTPDITQDKIMCEIEFSEKLRQTHYEKSIFVELIATFEGQVVDQIKAPLHHEMNLLSLDTRVGIDSNWGTQQWSPENPALYDLTIKLFEEDQLIDEISSYFGMRKISVEKDQILLNNRNLYQRLILDQGYWKDSGITPPSVEALELDIQRTMELGYNGLRKHQKIEDERFLYLCDKLGLLVWCEMPSPYSFTDTMIQPFVAEWLEIVRQYYNHPSIITWVPFNESWGIREIYRNKAQQQLTEGIYHLTKSIDPMRPVITNDGWEHTISDIITLHDYEAVGDILFERYKDKQQILENGIQFNKEKYAFADGFNYRGQPVIISEFGGIAFSSDDGWGYGEQVEDEKAFMDRFDNIHQAIQNLPYVVGFCYTQLTDVEQEVNGLLTTDRESKVLEEKIKAINERKINCHG